VCLVVLWVCRSRCTCAAVGFDLVAPELDNDEAMVEYVPKQHVDQLPDFLQVCGSAVFLFVGEVRSLSLRFCFCLLFGVCVCVCEFFTSTRVWVCLLPLSVWCVCVCVCVSYSLWPDPFASVAFQDTLEFEVSQLAPFTVNLVEALFDDGEEDDDNADEGDDDDME